MSVEKIFKNNFLNPSFKKMFSRVYVDNQVYVTDDQLKFSIP